MTAQAESSLLAGVDKALVIAFATPVAYFFAFQYDRGYLNFFGIPDILVDVSLRDLLIAGVTIGSVAYTVYIAFDSVLVILPERWPPRMKRRSIWLFWITVAIVLLLRVYDATPATQGIALASIVTISLVLVGLPIYKRAPHDITNKPPRIDPYASKGIVPELIRRGIQPMLVLAIGAFIMVCYFANLVGDAQARMQTSFLVHETDTGNLCAVVRVRDTEFLCADFDTGTRQLTGHYQFLKSEAATLLLREIGRLKSPTSAKSSPSLPRRDRRPNWIGPR